MVTMGRPTVRAELIFDHEIADELTEELVVTFREFGFDTEFRRTLTHRGVAELSWLLLAALPLQAFLTGLGSEAVKDLYAGVKKLTRNRAAKKTAGNGGTIPLVLQDSNSDLKIILEADLPEEAYQQLAGLDLSAYKIGPLHYDRQRKAWRSELDEAAG
jgi:hypothetical protein